MQETTTRRIIQDYIATMAARLKMSGSLNLNDDALGLEVFYRDVLNLTHKMSEGWELESANYFEPNADSIDLKDADKRVALQIGVNISSAKVTKGVARFLELSLNEDYDRFIFVGLDKTCALPKKLENASWVEIWKPTKAFNIAALGANELDALQKRIEWSLDFGKWGPKSDSQCFDVVLSVLNRDAILHLGPMEGDWKLASTALREIKQIVTEGELRSIKAKSFSKYLDPKYVEILEEIQDYVSQMLGLLNSSRQPGGDFYDLGPEGLSKMDHLRVELAGTVNRFAENNGHDIRLNFKHA